MTSSRFFVFRLIFTAAILLTAGAAVAQAPDGDGTVSFARALAEAYLHNPDLEAARAELRSVDEGYAQAMSGYRPRLTGEASYTSSHFDGDIFDTHADPKTVALELRQPLYRGGSTEAGVRASSNRIKAQRAVLHSVEQRVLLDAVTVYLDVRRDIELVRLNVNNQNVLERHLEASRQRFKLGDITKTDVSQAESRLANAVAGRVRAEGSLEASRARFERVVGLTAGNLPAPAYAVDIPATLEAAAALGEAQNPDIHFSEFSHAAAVANTRAVKGELLPQVDLTGSLGRTYDPAQRADDHVNTTSVGVVASIPLYTGGAVDARVRQSRQIESQRRMEQQRAARAVRQAVIDAWTELSAADSEMQARKSQIDAAKLALDGVRIEADYGSRTTLDLLDAEQEYLDAQVAHVIAERNKVVALYRLLSSTGELTAVRLGLDVRVYNPSANFQKVKNRWIGTSIRD
ncbi:MAG: TolC family outer membrane protein [Alphaproteobacteria bacterium]